MPSNCIGEWTEYGPCTENCGGGIQMRQYTIISPSMDGGTPCPETDGTTQTQPCNIDEPCCNMEELYENCKFMDISKSSWDLNTLRNKNDCESCIQFFNDCKDHKDYNKNLLEWSDMKKFFCEYENKSEVDSEKAREIDEEQERLCTIPGYMSNCINDVLNQQDKMTNASPSPASPCLSKSLWREGRMNNCRSMINSCEGPTTTSFIDIYNKIYVDSFKRSSNCQPLDDDGGGGGGAGEDGVDGVDGGDGDDADVEKPDAFTMFFKGLFDNIKYIYELILNLFKDEWPGEGGFIAHVLTIVALALAVVTASGLLVFCWKMLKKRGETTSSKTKKTSSTKKKKGSSGNDEDKGTMVVLLNMIQKLMEKDEK